MITLLAVFTSSFSWGSSNDIPPSNSNLTSLLKNDSIRTEAKSQFMYYAQDFYYELGDTALNYQAFSEALVGYHNLIKYDKLQRQAVLTVIDFSKPSSAERCYIIDVCNRKILHKTIVAHGVNSGRLFARHFSNDDNSHKSSLGFYVTTTTYHGKYKLALRLDGVDHSNSHASSRGVVMHGADYATYEFLEKNGGTLGRSYGCPAMPHENFEQVVEWIKGGSCLYIYHPNRSYHRYSRYLNRSNYLEDFLWFARS